MFFSNFLLTQLTSPSFPKNNFLELLSIPIISNPFSEKKAEASEPTNSQEPVTIQLTLI